MVETSLISLEPVRLEGAHVCLEPLTQAHHPGLCRVGLDPEIWRWVHTPPFTEVGMAAYIDDAIKLQTLGTGLPFALIDQRSGEPVGSTRFVEYSAKNRTVEIGWTWLAPAWQRTVFNTEAKFMLLRHAFEQLGCIRVQFKTDSLNERSQTALARIGATREGVLRNHMIVHDGRIRHSVYYSILDTEWPAVKAKLQTLLSSNV